MFPASPSRAKNGIIANLQVEARAHTIEDLRGMLNFFNFFFALSCLITKVLKKVSPKRAIEADLKAVKNPL